MMEENSVLKQLTNLQTNPTLHSKEKNQEINAQIINKTDVETYEELFSISKKEINFGQCLPGTIHEMKFTISLKKELIKPIELSMFFLCEDEMLYEPSSSIFSIKRNKQKYFKESINKRIKKKQDYQFIIQIITPMISEYDVQSVLYVHFSGFDPVLIPLKQKIRIPEIECTKELYNEEERVIKFSVIQNRNKNQFRLPFKLNQPTNLTVNAQVIGLFQQLYPLIEVKPKTLTTSGKGQFLFVLQMNMDNKIRETLLNGLSKIIRRVLILRIRDTNVMYHFPIQVIYHPSSNNPLLEQF